MYLEHDIVIDLLRPRKNVIHVVQNDTTQKLRLTLLANNSSYDIEADLKGESWKGFVSFIKSDKHGGEYDKTSTQGDNEWAVNLVSGTNNIFEVFLDGQCFTAYGRTEILVHFVTESGKDLHTFLIDVDVQADPASNVESTDFWRLESISDLRIAVRDLETISDGIQQDVDRLRDDVQGYDSIIEQLDQKRKLVYYAGDVPEDDHGPPDNAVIGLFSPAPETGDYIVGSNGYIGLVADVKYGRVLFGGTGQAIGGVAEYRVDVTEDFAASEKIDPAAYLASLDNGRYVLVYDNGSIIYHADTVVTADHKYTQITRYSDEALLDQSTYINGVLAAGAEIGEGFIDFGGRLLVSTPIDPRQAVTKEYVDMTISSYVDDKLRELDGNGVKF